MEEEEGGGEEVQEGEGRGPVYTFVSFPAEVKDKRTQEHAC
jgi:hypothetical protein